MSLRFKSLNDLGSGAWRVASSVPASMKIAALTPAACAATDGDSGPTPHDLLWDAVEGRWPSQAAREFKGAVPNRRFRLDIAFASAKLAIEVDGYRHHGRSLVNFKKDRARQNLLTLHGWRILRFSAGMIRTDMAGCLSTIHQALEPTHE